MLYISKTCSYTKYILCPRFSLNPILKYHITTTQSKQQSSWICSSVRPIPFFLPSVLYGAERGWFSLIRCHPCTGPGRISFAQSPPWPHPGPTPNHSLNGPIPHHLFLMGAIWGIGRVGAWAETRAGNAQKHVPSQAIEQGGTAKSAGGTCFFGPLIPCNKFYFCLNRQALADGIW